jgi:peptide/nickel transport system permease protein
VNRPLALGLALLVALCALAAASGLLAPHERGFSKSIYVEREEGRDVVYSAPEPPGRHFVLGSDVWGYDVYSEMLHGLRWTLCIVFFCATARCAIGLGSGLVLGSSRRSSFRRRGFTPLAAIPGFIIAAFVLFPLSINSPLPPAALFLVQSAVIVAVELPPVAASFAARTASLMAMPFVEAARVGGAGRAWILRRHVLPFAIVDFMEALPAQALSVAAMIGKLGVVRIFVGGTTMTLDPLIFLPAKGEWLGLLGYYYPDVAGRPWLFLAPFCGWLLVLACAGLLVAGSRRAYAASRRIEALR